MKESETGWPATGGTDVEFLRRCWQKMDATDRQEFLTFLQSEGVIISATETKFSGNK